MGGLIQNMLGIRDEDLHKPMFIRTKITIGDDTLVKMAHAFGKGLKGGELTSGERRTMKQINECPKLKQKLLDAKYQLIEEE